VEQRVWNGSTNYVDLTGVGLSNVQASIKGLNQVNEFGGNAGFEWNNKTSWIEGGGPYGTIITSNPYEGTYHYNISKSAGHTYGTTLTQTEEITYKEGDVLVASVYVKGNDSVVDGITITLQNFTTFWQNREYLALNVTTNWTRHTLSYVMPRTEAMRFSISFNKKTLTSFLDAVLLLRKQTTLVYGAVGATDSVSYIDGYTSPAFFNETQNTQNPTLTVGGQSVSHSGTLTNGTESSTTSLTGIFTGAVQVSANIQGSGQAILKINGTRVLYEDSIILRGRINGIYHGRYYGTFSPTTTTTNFIAVTNLASQITSVSYASNKLTLTVTSPSGTTSTSKVYCGNKGEPHTVTGATSWTYNSATKICTATVSHSSSKQVVLDWPPFLSIVDLVASMTPLLPIIIIPVVFGFVIMAIFKGGGKEIILVMGLLIVLVAGLILLMHFTSLVRQFV